MTQASRYLVEMARKCVAPYSVHPSARAAMLSGSAAEGVSDLFSDIDMMVYYETLPSADELEAARQANAGGERFWQFGSVEAGALMEAYPVDGIECQIVHSTVGAWEAQMAQVLEGHDVESPLQKALSGLINGLPLFGDEVINRWKARASAYPDGLRDKMVAHNLTFFPVWRMGDRFFSRDADLWFHQIRVESIQKLLGVLAGLNRVYYATFQFKQMAAFIAKLPIAPADLYDRIETALSAQPTAAAAMLGALVNETLDLVEQNMPQIDTVQARRQITREFKPWSMRVPHGG